MKSKITIITIVSITIVLLYCLYNGMLLSIIYNKNCMNLSNPEYQEILKAILNKNNISAQEIRILNKSFVLYKGNKFVDSLFVDSINKYEKKILPEGQTFNFINSKEKKLFEDSLKYYKMEYKKIRHNKDEYFIIELKDTAKTKNIFKKILKNG